jgi:hypothetical protein
MDAKASAISPSPRLISSVLGITPVREFPSLYCCMVYAILRTLEKVATAAFHKKPARLPDLVALRSYADANTHYGIRSHRMVAFIHHGIGVLHFVMPQNSVRFYLWPQPRYFYLCHTPLRHLSRVAASPDNQPALGDSLIVLEANSHYSRPIIKF